MKTAELNTRTAQLRPGKAHKSDAAKPAKASRLQVDMDYAIQAMVLLGLLGDVIAFRQHHQRGPLVVGIAAAVVVFFAYYSYYYVGLVYIGLLGLTVAAAWNVIAKRRCSACCFKEGK